MAENIEILILRGLPASGKTTYAKTLKTHKRVNNDELRAMIDNSAYSGKNEAFINSVSDFIILNAVKKGNSVVIDNTNLNPKTVQHISDLPYENSKNIVIKFKDFNIDVNEAILRDSKREKSVGAQVILDMYNKYISKEKTICENKKNAIIIDIDGTAAIMSDRNPFEFNRVYEDSVNDSVKSLIKNLNKDISLIFLSGRSYDCYSETNRWLKDKFFFNEDIEYSLYMRRSQDYRADNIVKYELYNEFIKDKFNILFVLDDRDSVVKMWRDDLKLSCFQVNPGNF